MAKRYIRGYFAIDFISFIPIGEIIEVVFHLHSLGKAIEWLHLLRVVQNLISFFFSEKIKIEKNVIFGKSQK